MQRRRPWRSALISTGAVVCAVAGASVWFAVKPGAPSPPAARWTSASLRTLSDTVTATGTVRLTTGASVRVGAQISGIVRKLNVTVGSRVGKGDVIAEIDPRPVLAKTAQAEAQLARAQVSAATARADYQRDRKLFDAGGLSAQQLEDARGASALADAAVGAARKDLAAASLDLDYVTLRAPISGVIASVSTQQGETVASAFAAPTFVTIIDPSALEVIAMVDEADIGGVRVGQSSTFTTETWPDREFEGEVVRIAPDATIVSGVVNYEVAIRIKSDVSSLKPQMTVNALILTAERRAVFAPSAAVLSGPSGRYVLVRGPDGAAKPRVVVLGARRGGEVEIKRGLNGGEPILLRPEPPK